MRKFLAFTLCILAVFCFSSCNKANIADTKTPVIINMPQDDSVNGYRIQNPADSNNTAVDAGSVTMDSSSKQNTNTGAEASEYCVNVNTGVFHKAECGSVSKMKDENKSYLSSRSKAVSQGYKPCSICNP